MKVILVTCHLILIAFLLITPSCSRSNNHFDSKVGVSDMVEIADMDHDQTVSCLLKKGYNLESQKQFMNSASLK